ncbi:MAG: cellulase family glycosylhydrolase [Prevotella sp.]|nr:cellulase family glycosylhydrolase [Prevotella sp.]
MKLKKITALFLAVLTCVLALTAGVSAADKKSIKLDRAKVTLSVGETCTLKPSVTGYKKVTVNWSSSDKSVAAVKKGVVTAKKAGTAKITVKIKDTDYKATCTVTVTDKKTSSKKTSDRNYTDAKELTSQMGVGWNLGNTLDSIGDWISGDLEHETAWGNIKTTKAMIDAVKKAGFKTVRIPVSWGEHMDSKGKVSSAWMNRVQEVVDYAYDNGMYVILNAHHENSWIKLTEKDEAAVSKKYKYLWQQIAERFKDYDEKLIFEGLNEPRTEGSAKEWSGGTSAEHKILNNYYKIFVDAVRGKGGYNKTRFLMIAPYAASSSYSAMAALEIPDDDRIIVSVHSYSPYNVALNTNSKEKTFTENGKKEIDSVFSNIDKAFLSKGIPVIIGEFGTINKSNTEERVKIAEYYVSTAKKYGVPCIWWDNSSVDQGSGKEGFGLLNRSKVEWYYPEIVKALVNSAK